MQVFIRFSLFFFLYLLVTACYQTEEETPIIEEPEEVQLMGTLTLGNVGARAYLFTAIEGEGITAELEEENADLSLVIGGRYTVINGAGAPHPFRLLGRQNAEILLSEDEATEGRFESDPDVDFQVEDFVIQFTLTPALAAELMPYVCGRHPSMTGNVIAVDAE